jgi:hypothetical protein
MKPGKSRFVAMAALLCMAGWTVVAGDANGLEEQSEKLAAVLNEGQIRQIGDNVGMFKKAGLSYQSSLVVPVEGVVACKDKKQLRILLGMYTFDANYALLFGKKQEFAATEGLRRDIPDRLNLRGKVKFTTFTPDELKKVLDNPDDPGNRDIYVKNASANIHDMVEASKSDREIADLFLDFSYGAVLQSLYVSSRLALGAGPGEQLVAIFNEQAARLDKFEEILAAYAENPDLETRADRSQRERVLQPVAEVLKTKKGNLAEADVVKILSLVEPERSKLVGKCP